MLLEDGAADVRVQQVSLKVVQVLDTHVEVLRCGRLADAVDEELFEPIEAVLVHRVDHGQVRNAKEEDRGPNGHRDVLCARLVDLLLGNLGFGNGDVDLVGGHLRDAKRVDQVRVVENVTLRVGEQVEDLVLQLLQLRLVGGGLHDELGLLFGQVGAFRLDGRDEQLILEAALGDRKVEQRHLDRDLWRVVRVGDDGGERELEVGVERDHVLAELDHERAARVLVSLVGEHRVEEGIERLDDVLDEHRGAQPDGHLKGLHDLLGRVARLDSLDLHLRLREL